MPNTKVLESKKAIVDALTQKLQGSTAAVFVDYKGITVAKDTELRNQFREAGVEYTVVKNTLTRFAAKNAGYNEFDELLNGTTALATTTGDPIAPARIICEFAKKNKDALKIKGGFVEGSVLSVDQLKGFGELPGKDALIEFYKEFVAAHPDDPFGYQWLLNLLLADGRCAEAREVLTKMDRVRHSYHTAMYLGMILRAEGKPDEALTQWQRMIEEFPDNGFAHFARASQLAFLCRYDEAREGFMNALERMQPRYVDAAEALAQLAELRGNYGEAIGWYEKVIEIARSDWNEDEGEMIDEPRRNIARLREKLA